MCGSMVSEHSLKKNEANYNLIEHSYSTSSTTVNNCTALPFYSRPGDSRGQSNNRSMSSENDDRPRVYVQHNYHDHYHDPIYTLNMVPEISNGSNVETARRRGPRGGVIEPFPIKLHNMLSQVDDEGFANVVSWQPHGRCFVIHQPSKFVTEVMPKHFKQTKFTSFQRQLNLYGFFRLTTGRDRGGYYHELFLRGRPDLCKSILRKRVKGNGVKPSPSPATEPCFYAMEPCLETKQAEEKLKNDLLSVCPEDRGSDTTQKEELPYHDRTGSSSFLTTQHVVTPTQDHEKKCFQHDQFLPPSSVLSLQSMVSSIAPSIVSKETSPVLSALPSPPQLPSPTFVLNGIGETDEDKIGESSIAQEVLVALEEDFSMNIDPLHELCNSCCDDASDESSDVSLPSLTTSSPSLIPHSGDRIFFEGRHFHYLDAFIMEELNNISDLQ